MPFGEYLLGLALLAVMLGSSAAAARLVLRRRLAHLAGSAAVAGYGLLLAATVLAVHVIPLALGVMSRPTVIGASLLALGLASRVPVAAPVSGNGPPSAPPASRLSWAAAAAAAGLAASYAVAFAASTLTTSVTAVDAHNIHLPQSGRWIQTGSLWQIDSLVPGWAFGNYPGNGDVFQLAAILPWHDDALVRFVSYPFLALAAIAVHAAARELGAQRPAAAIFAVLACSLPAGHAFALDAAMADTAMLGTFAAGILFGLRHARTGSRPDLVLGALGLGIALGTKWYGLSTAVVVAGVWAGARLLSRRRPADVARDTLVVTGVMAVAGGIWLVRNLLLSGNPVFPVKVSVLGLTLFDAPPDPIREAGGFALIDYVADPGAWELILSQLARSFGYGGLLLLVAMLTALVLALRSGRRRVAALAATGLACVLAYAATPYSAYGPEGRPFLMVASARYGMPALLVAAVAAAWLAGRHERAGAILQGAAVALVAEAMSRYPAFGGSAFRLEAGDLAVGTLGVALVAALVLAGRRLAPRPALRTRSALGAGVAVCAVALAAGGHHQQSRFAERRYAGIDPAYDWFLHNAGGERRVGIAGDFPNDRPAAWIAFGPRFDNRVEYVGRWVRERLERYASESAFRAALQEGGYDVVLVGLGRRRAQSAPEAGWTEAEGYAELARSHWVVVYGRD